MSRMAARPVIHEMWNNGMHLLKFKKNLKAGQVYHFAIVGSCHHFGA